MNNRITVIMMMILIVVVSGVPLIVAARPSLLQTTTPGCPTYLVNIIVDFVDSTPINAVAGITVITRFHVIYPDGTPVYLLPETTSFLWVGGQGQKEFLNVPVIFTGDPGWYNYTQTITDDLVQATGEGKVTVSVMTCSCSDGLGNRGPLTDVSSNTTFTPSDNSNVIIGPPQTTTTETEQPFTWAVPLAIALLLIIALLLFFLRSRRKKT